jgi:hypothetical protein
MINIYMAASAAVFSVALSSSRLLILLVIPPLSLAARLLYHNHNLHIRMISSYIHAEIRPLFSGDGTGRSALNWEGWYSERIGWIPRVRLPHALALPTVFVAPSVLALILVVPATVSWTWLGWILGAVLIVAQLTLPRLTRQPHAEAGPRKVERG